MSYRVTQTTKGVGLIEAIIVISVVSVAFAAILSASVIFLRSGLFAADKVQALYLLEEGVEAVRHLRNEGYTTNIMTNIGSGVFYLDPSAGGWTITTTNTPIFGTFTRTLELEDVYRRNTDDDIVPLTSGDPKYLDSETARLHVSVSWSGGSVELDTYVANIYEN